MPNAFSILATLFCLGRGPTTFAHGLIVGSRSSPSRWHSVCWTVAAFLSYSTAIAADISDIVLAVENVELPRMHQYVNPLLARSETRQFLRKTGEKRGYGKEWGPKTEEWTAIEETLVTAILASPRSEPDSARQSVPVRECVANLTDEERGAIIHLLGSSEWRNKVDELDNIGAIFAMLHIEDRSLRSGIDANVKTFKSEAVVQESKLETPERFRRQLATPASQECINLMFARILENNGPRSLPNGLKEKVLIDFGSFEARNKRLGGNWFLSAVRSGNRDRALELLENGIDVNFRGVDEYESKHVLHMLAEYGNQGASGDLGSILIERGADVNARDEYGATPLLKAVGKNRRDLVALLLDKGANISLAARYGSPLRLAVKYGNVPLAEYLTSRGASIGELNEHGETLLHSAVQERQARSVDWLLARGIDIEKQTVGGRYAAVHSAATISSDEMIRKLAAAGANLNARNGNGETPLHSAVQMVNYLDGRAPKLVSALVEFGADVTLSDKDGYTPLHRAAEGSIGGTPDQARLVLDYKLAIQKMLIDHGAKVGARNSEGETPLHLAYMPELVQALVDAGADINALDERKRSPLRSACLSGKRASVVAKLRALGVKDQECN